MTKLTSADSTPVEGIHYVTHYLADRGVDDVGKLAKLVFGPKANIALPGEHRHDRVGRVAAHRSGPSFDVYVVDIDDEEIDELRTEAGMHGDLEQVAICDRALEGDAAARAECARVCAEARARFGGNQ